MADSGSQCFFSTRRISVHSFLLLSRAPPPPCRKIEVLRPGMIRFQKTNDVMIFSGGAILSSSKQ